MDIKSSLCLVTLYPAWGSAAGAIGLDLVGCALGSLPASAWCYISDYLQDD